MRAPGVRARRIRRATTSTTAAAAALAALWAQTFLITGVMLDAIRQRRPTYQIGAKHWREGAIKGAIYSAIFILLVQFLAAAARDPALDARAREELWRSRVDTLLALVQFEGERSWLAAQGSRFDTALVQID